jgi:putative ABC transport system permease protein
VVPWAIITPGFFDAMGIRVLEGRLFGAADSATAPPVVVVTRAWARHYYPHESAIGKQMISGGCTTCPPTTVVGVVGDMKFLGLAGEGEAAYAPVTQDNPMGMSLVVRSPNAPGDVFPALRQAVAAVDPELAVAEITLRDRVQQSLADPRRWTAMIGAFAGAALLLAALGIFGLMSYVVRQRRRELGVRLALGAEPGTLTWLIVGRGMRYAAAGTVVGLGLSLLESRWLGSLLYGVGALDPATLVPVALMLLVAGLLACWIPGLRAARIGPAEVLSAE